MELSAARRLIDDQALFPVPLDLVAVGAVRQLVAVQTHAEHHVPVHVEHAARADQGAISLLRLHAGLRPVPHPAQVEAAEHVAGIDRHVAKEADADQRLALLVEERRRRATVDGGARVAADLVDQPLPVLSHGVRGEPQRLGDVILRRIDEPAAVERPVPLMRAAGEGLQEDQLLHLPGRSEHFPALQVFPLLQQQRGWGNGRMLGHVWLPTKGITTENTEDTEG